MSDQKLTHFLPDQIPDYVQEYFPMFVIFVTKYFEWLENTSSGVQYTIQNIRLNRDIDTTATNLKNQFLKTFVPNLPNISAVDDSILVKYFREFYRLKGSEKSYKFFFRAFFDDNIEITYPREVLFKPSDGNWYVERTLRVQAYVGDPETIQHTWVTGNTSQASAVVNRISKVFRRGTTASYYDLVLENLTGTFTSGETILGKYYDHINQTSSNLIMSSVSTVIVSDGRYLNTKSQLSNNQVLQDSYYYQQFSYKLRVRESPEFWADAVLKQIHPTGRIFFYDWYTDKTAQNNYSSVFVKNSIQEVSVRIPNSRSYLTKPTFTFDRTGDEQTGTSTTKIATTTGFTTVTYTSIGAISYSATYDYPGEHITWALQKTTDSFSSITEISRFDGASFDKLTATLSLDEQLIAWPWDVNSSLVVRRFSTGSSNLTANQYITSFSSDTLTYYDPDTAVPFITSNTSVGSMIVLVTWLKTSQGNNAAGESSNAVVLTFSSNLVINPYFSDEQQRNYKRIALGQTLEYPNLIYYHSSNSITSDLISGDPLSSTATGAIVFKPYNWERGSTYDRLAVKLNIGNPLQLNTSLTETFSTGNITASGVIASYEAFTTSVTATSFTSTVLSYYTFSSNCFIFNGDVSSSTNRYIQTTSFLQTGRLDCSLKYIVGDGFNGGDQPDAAEDLELQYSIDGGSSWYTGTKIWVGGSSNVWTYGRGQVGGKVNTTVGSTSIAGIGTNFGIDLRVGDRVVVDSSLTTVSAYTVTNILSNTLFNVDRVLIDSYRSSLAIVGIAYADNTNSSFTRIYGIGTQFNTEFTRDETLSWITSTGTSYTIINIASDTVLDVTPAFTTNYYSPASLSGTLTTLAGSTSITGLGTFFNTQVSTGTILRIGSSSIAVTSYTVINVNSDTSITVSPALVTTFASSETVLTGAINVASGSTSVTGTATVFDTQLSTGSVIRIGSSSATTTAYTVININNATSITVSPAVIPGYAATSAYAVTATSSWTVTGVGIYHINSGYNLWKLVPAAQQFQQTSVTVYGPATNTSVILRLTQLGPSTTPLNNDVYGIDNFKIDSYRFQNNQGVINFGLAVSSNSNLNTNDNDFFDVTTIGIL